MIGPERLPKYIQQITEFIKGARSFMADAKAKVDQEMGPESGGLDWEKLDPRQYDPRKIVRDALMEPTVPNNQTAESLGNPAEKPTDLGFGTYSALPEGQSAPFDSEAT